MTERSEFENPGFRNPDLTPAELQQILSLQGKMLREAVVRSDYSQLLDELCLLVESFIPDAAVSIMLFDANRQTLHVENAPSIPPAARSLVDGLRRGDGSCGNAVHHNEPMYVTETMSDARWRNVVHVAEQLRIESCFAFPIPNANNEPIGSFAISSFVPRTPDGFHAVLLETCASVCSVVLQRREDEELRGQMLKQEIKAERIESLGILAGGIAHDFNNLLTTVMSSVDLSRLILPPGQVRTSLDLAMKAIDRATGLTRQLSAVAKGNSPVLQPNNIVSIIRDSVDFALHGSSIRCEFSGFDSLQTPIVEVDAGQISRLIQNLVLNARHEMSSGGVIRVSCEETVETETAALPQGRYIRISIADDGPGISDEVLKNIFEPYVTKRESGSGLGLFVCYAIAQGHGGHIEVTSEQGSGATFTVFLPASEIAIAEAKVEVPTSSIPLSANVLIMDDDYQVRQTLRLVLEKVGCSVWEAENGEQAVDSYDRLQESGESIDVSILDLTVRGGMGGVETKNALRERDRFSKIILSSGYIGGADCKDYESAGFDAAMNKPYRVETVRQVLTEVLRKQYPSTLMSRKIS